MNQMQSFIEQAKKEKDLMTKLDALGASGAEADKIVALAAEHGFNITEADYRAASEQAGVQKRGELAEEDLEAAAGGATTNRYNPEVCSQYDNVHYNCVGFLEANWCDHYRRRIENDNPVQGKKTYFRKCMMGFFETSETFEKDWF